MTSEEKYTAKISNSLQYVSQHRSFWLFNFSFVDHLSPLQLILIPTCHIYSLSPSIFPFIKTKIEHSNDQKRRRINYTRASSIQQQRFPLALENSHRFRVKKWVSRRDAGQAAKKEYFIILSRAKKPRGAPELAELFSEGTVSARKDNSHDLNFSFVHRTPILKAIQS